MRIDDGSTSATFQVNKCSNTRCIIYAIFPSYITSDSSMNFKKTSIKHAINISVRILVNIESFEVAQNTLKKAFQYQTLVV